MGTVIEVQQHPAGSRGLVIEQPEVGAETDQFGVHADFYAYLLAARPQGLTTAALGDPTWRIGYSNLTGAALIPTGHGQIAVHAGDPVAHHKLLGWAERWQSLGRPGYAHPRPQLDQNEYG